MTTLESIRALATKENAAAYRATVEKFTFCIDLLEISAHHSQADHYVNALEDLFDELKPGLAPCTFCGKTEREPFTPAGFDAMTRCIRCERPCCGDCGENDIDGTSCGRDDCEAV